MRVVEVSCPSCGAPLTIGEDTKSTICEHCGSSIILDWEGQISAAVHLELGQTLLQAGEYDRSEEHFTRAVEKRAHSSDAWFWKGVATLLIRASRLYHSCEWEPAVQTSPDDLYLHKSGFTDKEAAEALIGWLGDSPCVDEVYHLANRAAAGGLINTAARTALWRHDSESRWPWIFDQALRGCQKRVPDTD
jgi:hypothetical protein